MKNPKEIKLVEICRSFALKANLGNYSSADFFASYKEETELERASETSERLFQSAKQDVERSVEAYLKERKEKVDDSTGLPIIQQEEKPQPRTKYGKDNCGCRFGATCDSHKAEGIIDAEAWKEEQKENRTFELEREQKELIEYEKQNI
ncbi:MAG: hypothetical protein AABZ55_08680 [Bdellovibrionota bacterium]